MKIGAELIKSKISIKLDEKRISAKRQSFGIAKSTWFNGTPVFVSKEDIGSLLELDLKILHLGIHDSLQWLLSNMTGEWRWTLAFSNSDDERDSRIYLITRIARRSDAIMYKLSRNVNSLKSLPDTVFGYG